MAQKTKASPAATGEARKHRLGSLNSSKGIPPDAGLQERRRRHLAKRGVGEPVASIVAELAFETGARR